MSYHRFLVLSFGIALILIITLPCGCQSLPRVTRDLIPTGSANANDVPNSLATDDSPPHRVSHRIIVRTPRGDFDLIGYVYIYPKTKTWMVIALSDMGLETMRLSGTHDTVRIEHALANLPSRYVSQGIARDIQHLFKLFPASRSQVKKRGRTLSVVPGLEGRDSREVYVFNEAGDACEISYSLTGKRIAREVRYNYWHTKPSANISFPGEATLTNHRLNYSLTIKLLDIKLFPEHAPSVADRLAS